MPISPQNFSTSVASISLYTPATPFNDPTSIIRRAPEDWFRHYNKAPLPFPVPPDAPSEIPRLVFRNADESEKLTFGKDWITFYRGMTVEKHEHICLPSFIKDALLLMAQAKESFDLKFGRVGFVINRICPVEYSSREIATHFLKEKFLVSPFNRPENIEINSHKTYELACGIKINSWFKNRSANIITSNEDVVLVEQDMNTLANDASVNDFDSDLIENITNQMASELDHVFSLYYPEA